MSFSDAERIAAAQSYIDSLSTHRAADIPFTPDCQRIEVGIKTGRNADHLRRSLERGPQFKIIEGTTAPEFTVEGDNVRAKFDVLTKPRLFGRRVCSHVDEIFVIPAEDSSGSPKIHHINAKIVPFIRR
ncbi:hypothetical protein ABIA30_002203 [Mycobacterium sp. MAA66]|uniref:hypothetical protein n=1 Tax=Mycobacterium sp. MAA66 TaxID=3156297 RepID=UPI00351201BC